MSAASAESNSTVHVPHANTPATIAHCVSWFFAISSPGSEIGVVKKEAINSDWQMRTLVSYGM